MKQHHRDRPQDRAERVLVADIGGTTARFGVASMDSQQSRPALNNCRMYDCSDFNSLTAVLSAYLDTLIQDRPNKACLSVAAPVYASTVKLTNRDWSFDRAALAQRFGFEQLDIINDFAALAHVVHQLEADELLSLNDSAGVSEGCEGTVAVMGPGTGFGLSFVIQNTGSTSSNDNRTVIASEGGHMGFPVATSDEQIVVDYLSQRVGRVEIEHVLSGTGLENIYQALRQHHGGGETIMSAAQISQAAMVSRDELAVRCLDLFCGAMGRVAADIALGFGARRGVFLAGGILPRLIPFLSESSFKESFRDKASMNDYVSSIPVSLVTAPYATLSGAACWFDRVHHTSSMGESHDGV